MNQKSDSKNMKKSYKMKITKRKIKIKKEILKWKNKWQPTQKLKISFVAQWKTVKEKKQKIK